MAKDSERFNRLMERFIKEWLVGMTISEQFQKYPQTPRIAYFRLKEIEEKTEVKEVQEEKGEQS